MQLAAQQPEVEPAEALRQYYAHLFQHFGPQRWWPARTRLEIILGAILTQNTNWHNAALAIKRLRKAKLLSWPRLRKASVGKLEACIRPAGFYRQKARVIRNFVDWLEGTYRGSLAALFARLPGEARRELLQLRGLGPETVDAILLYAGRQPSFVADAYTRRILSRHELLPATASYSATQQFLHEHLPADHVLFNEFHALLVELGKHYCKRPAPHCDGCPLERFMPSGRRPQPSRRPVELEDVAGQRELQTA